MDYEQSERREMSMVMYSWCDVLLDVSKECIFAMNPVLSVVEQRFFCFLTICFKKN